MTQAQLHSLVWKRFIRMPYGHLLDYADPQGQTTIPTPEECAVCNPNPMGWWTPIENGSFFGGLYLYALLEEYKLSHSEQLAEEIQILANGMKLLKDISSNDGFIARGVATDGISHYPMSSEDQVAPWVLGMYAYMNSSLCSDQEAIRDRIICTLRGLKANDWCIVSDAPYNCRSNNWGKGTDWRGVCKLLYCAHTLYALTGEEEDRKHYLNLRDGKPENCIYTRWQIAGHGYAHDMVRTTSLIQFWIDVCAHLALRHLSIVDVERSVDYQNGCVSNGITVLPFLEDIAKYDNVAGQFGLNWRILQHMHIPFDGNVEAAVQNAGKQCGFWQECEAKHRPMEHKVLGNALFGAWIALTCGNSDIAHEAARTLPALIDSVDWPSVTVSYAFVAEGCLILSKLLCK